MRAAFILVVLAAGCGAQSAISSPPPTAPIPTGGFVPSAWPPPPPPPRLPPRSSDATVAGEVSSSDPAAQTVSSSEPDPDAPKQSIPKFGGKMTRPIIPGAPRMTPEAVENHVTGKMLVKCIIRKTGVIEHCKILKGLPYMNAAVLAWLSSVRAGPVTMEGAPIDASVTIPFNFQLLSDAHDKP